MFWPRTPPEYKFREFRVLMMQCNDMMMMMMIRRKVNESG
jgi:hypothetical protein